MKKILVVNSFPSNRYLSDVLKQNNIYSVGLYTVDFALLDDYIKPDADLFSELVYLPNADVEHIINLLAHHSFEYVINGDDSFLNLSERLAQHYSPHYACNPQTSAWRSNKIEMHNQLAKAGIGHINQRLVNATNYAQISTEYSLPVFVKPLNGAGSNGAQIINSTSELVEYFQKNHANKTLNGEAIEEFILAELISGEEYLIDSFSINGHHHIASIQKYDKEIVGGFPKYLSWEVERDQLKLVRISDYVREVLNVTGFKNGFSHIECFYTPEEDVRLIEINPRISGAKGFSHRIANASGQASQIDIMLEQIFAVRVPMSSCEQEARMLVLYNGGANVMPYLQQMNLAAYGVTAVEQLIPPGKCSKATIKSLTDAAAFAIVVADTAAELVARADLIQELDGNAWSIQ